MYASELRTCGLGAVVAVLLGTGVGVGWHYFADSAGGRAVAAAATPLTKQDAPNPPSSNPPSRPEGPVFDVLRSPALSRASGMALDLSDEQKLALVSLLTRSIADDRHPSSSRVRTLKDILVKLDAKPPAQPYLAPNANAPPDDTRTRARHRDSSAARGKVLHAGLLGSLVAVPVALLFMRDCSTGRRGTAR